MKKIESYSDLKVRQKDMALRCVYSHKAIAEAVRQAVG
jgi:hypothetical protein